MSYQRRRFTPAAASSEIERLLYHMPTVAALAEKTWTKGFAQSVCKQAIRRNWKPSEKQLSVMRELVGDLFKSESDHEQEDDFQVIE